jgi:hypothetical protein
MRTSLAALQQIDKGLAKEWKAHAKTRIAEPFAHQLARQAPAGAKGAAAGRSIRTGAGALPIIYAGKGTWQGWQPFFALEYGMSHDKYHTYVRTSPKGRRHVVRRRVGTWAPVHRGRRGYWFHPYFTAHLPEQRVKVVRLADDFIRGAL